MAIDYQILGKPQHDNALLVRVSTGQSMYRLLFDCGEGCLDTLEFSELREIDHLFFSHLHMDHVAGFDRFFRCNYDRPGKRNSFWGPAGTQEILQHRFMGYLWNLHEGMTSSCVVHTIAPDQVRCHRYELEEAYSISHEHPTSASSDLLIDQPSFQVRPIFLNHGTSSIGYIVHEKERMNIDTARLKDLNLSPGPWLKHLRGGGDPDMILGPEGGGMRLGDLIEKVVTITAGSSIAYLTDFIVDDQEIDFLAKKLQGCRHLICESQYLTEDRELAVKNHHLTVTESAKIAARAQVDDLILIHVSTRYSETQWRGALQEAKAIFPKARFATHW
jgi:ribonuclease Z